jgi:hypothetical protein
MFAAGCAIAVLVGMLSTWAERFEMGADGVSYLDLGDAWWRGDWRNAVNGLWSPLYSVVVGGVLKVAKPSAYWEFPVVHLTNFGIYLCMLAAFCVFLKSLLQYQREINGGDPRANRPGLPEWVVIMLGFGLFLVSSVKLTTASATTPDALMGALLYLALGIVLRIVINPLRWLPYTLLGLVLGAGYLAKTPMLFLSAVVYGMLLVGQSLRRWVAPRVALSIAVFLAVGSPYIVGLSVAKGHLTLGESGALNYAWHVNGVPRFHWRGELKGSGDAVHPTRKLNDSPAVYEFGEPIQGTYPIWYDAAYWNEGVKAHLDVGRQLKVIRSGLSTYFYVFTNLLWGFTLASVTLCIIAGRNVWRDLRKAWPVVLPALAGFCMYVLVHAETRYLTTLTVTLALGFLAFLRVDARRASLAIKICLAAAVLLTWNVISWSAQSAHNELVALSSSAIPDPHWEIAHALAQVGVQPGNKVAYCRPPLAYGNYPWARLARVKITAEIPPADAPLFWASSNADQDHILQMLRDNGVSWIVAGAPPRDLPQPWLRLGTTDHYVRRLN